MKILCFAPHSAIWVHAFPEALVIEALKQSGHDIVYVTCGGVFDRLCVSMGAHGVGIDAPPKAKKAICDTCNAYAQTIRAEFGFSSCELSDVLTAQDRAWVKATLERTTPENLLSLTEGNVELGRIALSHFLINHKKSKLEFSDHDWRRYVTDLENTLLSYAACRTLFDREKPDRVLVYTAAYSVNFACCEIAHVLGIPHYYMAAAGNLSDRLQRLALARGHAVDFQKNNIVHWPRFRDVPISADDINYIVDHFLELLRGHSPFVYSSPSGAAKRDLRKFFGVRPGQKLMLATTSSYDEMFASQICGLWPTDVRTAFPTLIDWIRAIIGYVAARPSLFLILRVHPREFPGKRDSVMSEHVSLLQKVLLELPDNVKVNWPTDNISLYDLACVTDVGLNAWSSAGKELSLFGIPVVTYAPELLAFPAELNYAAVDPASYFAQIERALTEGWSVENARRAFRWYTLEYERAMLDLSDSVSFSETRRASLFERGVRRVRRTFTPQYRQLSDCRGRAPSLRQRQLINDLITSGKISVLDLIERSQISGAPLDEETEGLRGGFRRMVAALVGSTASAKWDGPLARMQAFADSGPRTEAARFGT